MSREIAAPKIAHVEEELVLAVKEMSTLVANLLVCV